MVVQQISKVFGLFHVIAIGDDVYFSAAEVTEKLGYTYPSKALHDNVQRKDIGYIRRKEAEGDMCFLWSNPEDNTRKPVINEAGFYSLVAGSKLETAKEFKRWVCEEVLPSVRKNGGYIAGQENLPGKERAALEAQVADLASKVARLTKRRRQLLQEVKNLKCKARKAKATRAKLEEYCSLHEEMYERLMQDYLKLVPKPKPEPEPRRKRYKVTVDRFGNVLKIVSE